MSIYGAINDTVFKLDASDGSTLWEHDTSFEGVYDEWQCVVTDPSGYIYICAQPLLEKRQADYTLEWSVTNNDFLMWRAHVDIDGNVYVTGREYARKYDSQGSQVWECALSIFDGDRSVLSSDGCLYVAERGETTLIKIDSDGNEVTSGNWPVTVTWPDKGGIMDLCLTPDDGVIVTRYGEADTTSVYAEKYDSSGSRQWYRSMWSGNNIYSPTVGLDGYFYFAESSADTVHKMLHSDGNDKDPGSWPLSIPYGASAVYAACDGYIYVHNDNRTIYKFATDGTEVYAEESARNYLKSPSAMSVSPGLNSLGMCPATFTITASSDEYGSISPSGNVEVVEGDDQTFNISPATSYEIDDVTVDGVSQGAISSYTFTNVTEPHTISASFAVAISHTITSIANTGGVIDPSGDVEVAETYDQTFNIYPASSYGISDVVVDGTSQGAISSYTFTDVTEDHTIEAFFVVADLYNTYRCYYPDRYTSEYRVRKLSPQGFQLWEFGSESDDTRAYETRLRDVYAGPSNQVWACDSAGKLYCLDADTGSKIWEFTHSTGLTQVVVASDEAAYALDYDDEIIKIDASGNEVTTGFPITDFADVDQLEIGPSDHLYVSGTISDRSWLYHYDTAGSMQNSYQSPSGTWMGGFGVNSAGEVAVYQYMSTSTTEDNLVKLDASLNVSWSVTEGVLSSITSGSRAIVDDDGDVYNFIDDDDVVTKHADSDGTKLWTVDVSVMQNFRGIMPDGNLYLDTAGSVNYNEYTVIDPNGVILEERASFLAYHGYLSGFSSENSLAAGRVIDISQNNNGRVLPAESHIKAVEEFVENPEFIIVKDGSDFTIRISPNLGYSVSDVLVDDVSQGVVSSYSFTNITSDHTIEATFEGSSVDAGGDLIVVETNGIFKKIDALGNLVFEQEETTAFCCAFDNQNNCYFGVEKNSEEYYVIKFGSDDLVEWEYSLISAPTSIATDANCNCIIGRNDGHVLKISSGGVFIKLSPVFSGAVDSICVDPIGDVFVGSSEDDTVVKLDSELEEQWTAVGETDIAILDVGLDDYIYYTRGSGFQRRLERRTVQGDFSSYDPEIPSDGYGGIYDGIQFYTANGIYESDGTRLITFSPEIVFASGKEGWAYTGSDSERKICKFDPNGSLKWSYSDTESGYIKDIAVYPGPRGSGVWSTLHSISSSSETGGSISPDEDVSVVEGEDIVFSISPDFEYEIDDVVVDGVSQGAISSYTFTDVTEDHTISVSFSLLTTSDISITINGSGSVLPSGSSVSVPAGKSQSFGFFPDYGSKIDRVVVDGVEQGKIGAYVFSDVTENHSIEIFFVDNEVAVSGILYCINSDHQIEKLNGSDSVVWTYDRTSNITCLVVDDDGYVYGGTLDAEVFKLSHDGDLLWEVSDCPYSLKYLKIGPNKNIYARGDSNYLFKLDYAGSLLWSFQAPGEATFKRFAVGNDEKVYVASSGDLSVKEYSQSGALLESYPTDSSLSPNSVVLDSNGDIRFERTRAVDAVIDDTDNVYAIFYSDDSYGGDSSLSKYDASDTLIWKINVTEAYQVVMGALGLYYIDLSTDEIVLVDFDGDEVKRYDDSAYSDVDVSFGEYGDDSWLSKFVITTETQGNGSISPSGTFEIVEGDRASFEFIPDLNNQLSKVLVNSEEKRLKYNYVFYGVFQDSTLTAVFESVPVSPVNYVYALSSENGATTNSYLRKIDIDGNEITSGNWPINSGNVYASGLGCLNGNIYYSVEETKVIKIDSDANQIWSCTVSSVKAIVVSVEECVYFGFLEGVGKIDSDGNEVTSGNWPISVSSSSPTAMACDRKGNLFIVHDSSYRKISKYTSDGELVWTMTDTDEDNQYTSLSADLSGNLCAGCSNGKIVYVSHKGNKLYTFQALENQINSVFVARNYIYAAGRYGEFSRVAFDWADTTQNESSSEISREIMILINDERSKEGIMPLQFNADLEAAALQHSLDMSDNEFLSHTGSDGSSSLDRIIENGYLDDLDSGTEYGTGENIASGYVSAEDLVAAWMSSSGHRANILNPDFQSAGVSRQESASSTYYYTMNFGYRTDESIDTSFDFVPSYILWKTTNAIGNDDDLKTIAGDSAGNTYVGGGKSEYRGTTSRFDAGGGEQFSFTGHSEIVKFVATSEGEYSTGNWPGIANTQSMFLKLGAIYNTSLKNSPLGTGTNFSFLGAFSYTKNQQSFLYYTGFLRHFFNYFGGLGIDIGQLHSNPLGVWRTFLMSENIGVFTKQMLLSQIGTYLTTNQKNVYTISGDVVHNQQLLLLKLLNNNDVRNLQKIETLLGNYATHSYNIDNEVYIDSRPLSRRYSTDSIDIFFDQSSVHNEITISANDPDLFEWADPKVGYGTPRLEVHVGTKVLQFLLESRDGERNNFVLSGRSMTALEDEPYSEDIDFESEEPKLASELAESFTNSTVVDWQAVDWVVPAGFSFSGKPIDGIQALAEAIGAIVRAQEDGSLLVRNRWAVRPVNMDSAVADINYDRTKLISLSHQTDRESGYNAVTVIGSSANTQEPSLSLEESSPVLGQEVHVRCYWAGKVSTDIDLFVTDGDISDLGFFTSIEEEDISFVNGEASVSLPIYEFLGIEWVGESGVSINHIKNEKSIFIDDSDFDNQPQKAFRVARVKYRTRYQRFRLYEHDVERLLAVIFLSSEPNVYVDIRTEDAPVYGPPIDSDLLTTEESAIARGRAWIDENKYRTHTLQIEAPYDDLAVDGKLVYINDDEIGNPGNYQIVSSGINISGPKITNTLGVKKCQISFPY